MIIMSVQSYTDKQLNQFAEPRYVNKKDLQFLVDNSVYSVRENELIKLSILEQFGYTEYDVLEGKIKSKIEKNKVNK